MPAIENQKQNIEDHGYDNELFQIISSKMHRWKNKTISVKIDKKKKTPDIKEKK